MLQFILAQAAAGDSNYGNLIMMVIVIAVFYIFMIYPQQQKSKKHKKFLESLKKGDEVVTIGGAHGVVVEISDNTVVLDVDRGTKITFDKSSIAVDTNKKETKK
jgi:preprotein translocase subunit YajC